MIQMVGNHNCRFCAAALETIRKEHLPIEFFDMAVSVSNIKKFLAIREGNPDLFSEHRKNNKVGVPLFILSDGTITFDSEQAFAAARAQRKPCIEMVGTRICPDCPPVLEVVEAEKLPVEFYDIGEQMADMKKFLAIREGNPQIYDAVREKGAVGIPVFVLTDGTVTLDAERALDAARELKERS